MAHGKTLDLIEFAREIRGRVMPPRETRERDRSLRGKARRKARRSAS